MERTHDRLAYERVTESRIARSSFHERLTAKIAELLRHLVVGAMETHRRRLGPLEGFVGIEKQGSCCTDAERQGHKLTAFINDVIAEMELGDMNLLFDLASDH